MQTSCKFLKMTALKGKTHHQAHTAHVLPILSPAGLLALFPLPQKVKHCVSHGFRGAGPRGLGRVPH